VGKLPWVKYYYADIEQDTRCLTPLAYGGWQRILNQMWHHRHKSFKEFNGTLSGDLIFWNAITGGNVQDTKKIISEIISRKICEGNDSSQKNNGIIMIGCRRIMAEQKEKENNRLRQLRFKRKHNNNGIKTNESQINNPIEDRSPKKTIDNIQKDNKGKSKDCHPVYKVGDNLKTDESIESKAFALKKISDRIKWIFKAKNYKFNSSHEDQANLLKIINKQTLLKLTNEQVLNLLDDFYLYWFKTDDKKTGESLYLKIASKQHMVNLLLKHYERQKAYYDKQRGER
jgi:hypothetical protein